MSIVVQVHGRKDPRALAELIRDTLQDSAVVDGEASVAHLSVLVDTEEREAAQRRAVWHWLNAGSPNAIDKDNDWSDV
jgi:hypothetical protein